MVLLQLERSKVSDWPADQPGDGVRLLEDHRQRQGDLPLWSVGWDEEDPCVLQGESSQGGEDQLGDA